MSYCRLRSMVLKEFRQLRRDRASLRLFVIATVLQCIFYGYAITTDLRGMPVGIVAEDGSPESQRLIDSLTTSDAFQVTRLGRSPADLADWLRQGDVVFAVHIPADFARDLRLRRAPAVQVLTDASDPNTAAIGYRYLAGALRQSVAELGADKAAARPESGRGSLRGIELAPRFWYNPALRSSDFVVPAVLAVVLLTVLMAHTSLMVAKERELGTLEQLAVTPLTATEVLVGKTVPVAGVGILTSVVITAVLCAWFQLTLRGSVLCLAVGTLLYLLNTLGLGLLISVIAKTQFEGQLTSDFLAKPLILLSGFLFPISSIPEWAQRITFFLPTRYFMEMLRGIFLKGNGFAELWLQLLALCALGTLFYLGGVLALGVRQE